MPINTDLNIAPYFDDYDITKQFHRILFKPAYAVQARELTQMQTILQNQVEQFGSNIFQEGSIIKGCTFTQLSNLKYVKLSDKAGFDISLYVGGVEEGIETYFEVESVNTGLKAAIVAATAGFETRQPDLATFFINYLNTTVNSTVKEFIAGENLIINKYVVEDGITTGPTQVETVQVTSITGPSGSVLRHVGNSYGVAVSDGIVFQKGHFVYTPEQTVIVSKYDPVPDDVSVGYVIEETVVSALQDETLFDNAIGSPNLNAPGADRLKLSPVLTAVTADQLSVSPPLFPNFFTLMKFEAGNLIEVRDVSQYNAIAQEMARRTYEESGNYIVKEFQTKVIKRQKLASFDANSNPVYTDAPHISLSPGVAYVNGFRVESTGERFFEIDPISNTDVGSQQSQPISFAYGGYVPVTDASGLLNIADFSRIELYDANTASVVGSAIVKNYENDRLYLMDIRMTGNNSFSDIEFVRQNSSNSLIGITPRVMDTATPNVLLFDTGTVNTKSMDNLNVIVRGSASVSVSGNTSVSYTLAALDEDFNVQTQDLLLVDATNVVINIESFSYASANKTINITLVAGQSPAATATLYFNKRIIDVDVRSKQSTEVFVKTTFDTAITKYTLGMPDAYKIVSIIGSAANTDYTDSFKLVQNQKDNYYDLSYIELKPSAPAPADAEVLTIKVKVFQLLSATRHIFTVNSYKDEVLGDLSPDQIPEYISTNGTIYSLTNCIDFRPYRDAIASYSTTAGGASLFNPSANTSHIVDQSIVISAPGGGLSYLIPAQDNSATADIDYFYNRTDAVTIDSYGKFGIIKGEPAAKSRAPRVENKLVIAEVYIPGNVLYTKEEALDNSAKLQHVPAIDKKGVKNYTMADIDGIAKQVQRLTYYASLFALQNSAQSLNILDDNGLNRFKNGILVDPFSDFSIAEMNSLEFNSSIDFTENTVSPSVISFPVNMEIVTGTTVNTAAFPSDNPETITLENDSDSIVLLEQKYATSFRSCTSNLYSFKATSEIWPDYDAAYDTVTNPVRLDIDMATPFSDLVEGLQEFIPLTSTSTRLLSSTSESNTTRRRRGGLAGLFGKSRSTTTTTTTRVFEDVTRSLQVLEGTREQNLGEFVTNSEFLPYMRSRTVNLVFYGLRPNTRHYAYFDKQDVNARCAPGKFPGNSTQVQSIGTAGAYGDAMTSDSNGILAIVFNLPAETFFVGERIFEIADVNSYDAIASAATSKGFAAYNAYNFKVEKAGVVASTRTAKPTVITNRTTRTVTTRTVSRPPIIINNGGRSSDRGGDPIAQTFFIKQGMGQGSDTVFVSAIDLYFKRKSSSNGVTVMLRETVNGYPGPDIIPFAQVHLMPSQVAVSEDASEVTTVRFPVPIRLDVEKEYCFVVQPDADDPEYLIFIAALGANDLTTGESVNVSWGDGVLFTSTNNRSWQSYQSEDIKFTLYRHNYAATEGSIEVQLDSPEFFTITNNSGKFTIGEMAYKIAGTANNVSVSAGNNQIVGTNINSLGYTVGDYILIDGPDYSELLQISVTETGNTDLMFASTTSSITGTVAARPVVAGKVIYYNPRNPTELYLEASSARTAKLFSATDVVYGLTSGAETTISSVDNIGLSYIQPFFNKTTDSDTSVSILGLFTDASLNPYELTVPFNDKTSFHEKGALVYSTSKNLLEVTPKRFKFRLNLTSEGNTTSPFLDIGTAHIMAYKYKISNDSATTAKYISKIVELEENFDAEDFQLYVTAYKPSGTNVKTYVRVQNASDSLKFDSNEWIELELNGAGIESSTVNRNDFREYVYKIPEANKIGGVVTYTNDVGVFTGYTRFAVKIELLSTNSYNVPRIADYRGIALT